VSNRSSHDALRSQGCLPFSSAAMSRKWATSSAPKWPPPARSGRFFQRPLSETLRLARPRNVICRSPRADRDATLERELAEHRGCQKRVPRVRFDPLGWFLVRPIARCHGPERVDLSCLRWRSALGHRRARSRHRPRQASGTRILTTATVGKDPPHGGTKCRILTTSSTSSLAARQRIRPDMSN
jgi:hypothetical protein